MCVFWLQKFCMDFPPCIRLIFNHSPMEVSLIVILIPPQVTQILVMDMESQVEVPIVVV